ncbi:MAG: hypothetical protein WCA20_04060 [Candidatus Sulfotelmatobacter sp.]
MLRQRQWRVLQFGPDVLRQQHGGLDMLLFRSGLLHGCFQTLLQRCKNDVLPGGILQLDSDVL